jgi:hypothetical protein
MRDPGAHARLDIDEADGAGSSLVAQTAQAVAEAPHVVLRAAFRRLGQAKRDPTIPLIVRLDRGAGALGIVCHQLPPKKSDQGLRPWTQDVRR